MDNITKDMTLDCSEVFAPVVSLYKVKTFEEAIKEANKVEYGLLTAIFTENLDLQFI